MKKNKITAVFLSLLLSFQLAGAVEPIDSVSNDSNKKAFAVLESFTSEGCSSCPGFDELFSQLERAAEKENTTTIFLNYHVPYWDHLGWKDELAVKKFENYQDYYSSYFPNAKSYTPQVVINGTNEYEGNDETQIKRAIEHAMWHPKENYFVTSKAFKKDSAFVTTICELSSIPPNCQIQVVLVEKDLPEVKVKSGENKGQRINHYSAVRLLETIAEPSLKNRLDMKFNAKMSLKKSDRKFSVVFLLQDKTGREIYSVESCNLKL